MPKKGYKQTPEHIAASALGRTGLKRGPHTEETKVKISQGNIGKLAWNKGLPMPRNQKAIEKMKITMATEESKRKRSKSHKGQKAWNKDRIYTPEERLKISIATKRGMTPEVRLKVSVALKGRKNPGQSARLKGRKLSPEHRKAIADAFAKHPKDCNCKAHKPFVVKPTPSKPQLKLASILENLGFRVILEQPFDRCTADIYLPDHHIDVEYDGDYWHQDKKRDRKRDYFLKKRFGLTIIRFRKSDLDGAEESILRKLNAPRLRALVEGRSIDNERGE